MSDYFDRVEQGMRDAVRRGAHIPWYARLRLRPSRPAAAVLVCLAVTGSAFAATGAFRTGAPVGAEVPAIPTADQGAVIPASITVLPLRVPDPPAGRHGGCASCRRPEGWRVCRLAGSWTGALACSDAMGRSTTTARSTRSLSNFMEGPGCGTEDARGDAFVNEQLHGIPASALFGDEQHIFGGCYEPHPSQKACPQADRRDVYFGLLGPDAEERHPRHRAGGTAATPTAGPRRGLSDRPAAQHDALSVRAHRSASAPTPATPAAPR